MGWGGGQYSELHHTSLVICVSFLIARVPVLLIERGMCVCVVVVGGGGGGGGNNHNHKG